MRKNEVTPWSKSYTLGGKMPRSSGQFIGFRVTDEDHAAWQRMAHARRMSLSELLRTAIRNEHARWEQTEARPALNVSLKRSKDTL